MGRLCPPSQAIRRMMWDRASSRSCARGACQSHSAVTHRSGWCRRVSGQRAGEEEVVLSWRGGDGGPGSGGLRAEARCRHASASAGLSLRFSRPRLRRQQLSHLQCAPESTAPRCVRRSFAPQAGPVPPAGCAPSLGVLSQPPSRLQTKSRTTSPRPSSTSTPVLRSIDPNCL